MQLIKFHKVLIASGILFFLLFGIREFIVTPGATGILRGTLSLVGAIGMGFYLKWVIKRYRNGF